MKPQEEHARTMLSRVKSFALQRYRLCPKHISDQHFWKVYFILIDNYCRHRLAQSASSSASTSPSSSSSSSSPSLSSNVVGGFDFSLIDRLVANNLAVEAERRHHDTLDVNSDADDDEETHHTAVALARLHDTQTDPHASSSSSDSSSSSSSSSSAGGASATKEDDDEVNLCVDGVDLNEVVAQQQQEQQLQDDDDFDLLQHLDAAHLVDELDIPSHITLDLNKNAVSSTKANFASEDELP